MKKLFILFGLLLLVGCNNKEKEEDTFKFRDEIQAIIAIDQGPEPTDPQEIKNADEINIFVDAMQNADRYQGPVSDVGSRYKLEVTYKNDATETIDLWLFSSITGRFEVDDVKYSLNEKAIPKLINFLGK
ncbi:hypothetical protein FQ087_08430 [Sporosarcina sp. ANT_H38]|uniref:hypothetical protein n=1 Tax=Sporosarcina sp. ANT_H38 TaxID=2597358 RepID=UPI0011F1ED93|nr:hypothetical protein [Sporosarcina sp. ANT_H38]KAA0966251.1 hypothetical protein FQ087_08430 [Sporosarcina sp. ANT_H38]